MNMANELSVRVALAPMSDLDVVRYAESFMESHRASVHDTACALIVDLSERLRRLATPASAPVGETREQLLDALKPFAEFARQWNRQPLSRIADEVYGIHGGTEYEAYLRLSDCRRALEVYDAARAAERRDQEEGR